MLLLKSQFPSFEQRMCKNYYEQRIAKEFGEQLCSGATESSRSVDLVDQYASHTARREEFMKSLELAKRYRLRVTSVDYRTEVNCKFVCKSHDDHIVVTISHKSICLKNGDICKYTKNGTELCSHILYILLNKVQLEEDDCRLNQTAYTSTELMLG